MNPDNLKTQPARLVPALSTKFTAIALLAALTLAACSAHSSPDALWNIVDGQCRPHQAESGNPLPCTRVDLAPGKGYAVLKDRNGIAQFLLIPTMRITGIESPELLAEAAPNYWAYAWQEKADVEERLHRKLARDQIALAVNSAYGRTQNQLHIHVDCIRPDIRDSLRQQAAEIGIQWKPLPIALNHHRYQAMRIPGPELGERNPFKLLAQGLPGAREHMDRHTLVLTGATFENGAEGFILLADEAALASLDRGSGEELLDHDCAVAGKAD